MRITLYSNRIIWNIWSGNNYFYGTNASIPLEIDESDFEFFKKYFYPLSYAGVSSIYGQGCSTVITLNYPCIDKYIENLNSKDPAIRKLTVTILLDENKLT